MICRQHFEAVPVRQYSLLNAERLEGEQRLDDQGHIIAEQSAIPTEARW